MSQFFIEYIQPYINIDEGTFYTLVINIIVGIIVPFIQFIVRKINERPRWHVKATSKLIEDRQVFFLVIMIINLFIPMLFLIAASFFYTSFYKEFYYVQILFFSSKSVNQLLIMLQCIMSFSYYKILTFYFIEIYNPNDLNKNIRKIVLACTILLGMTYVNVGIYGKGNNHILLIILMLLFTIVTIIGLFVFSGYVINCYYHAYAKIQLKNNDTIWEIDILNLDKVNGWFVVKSKHWETRVKESEISQIVYYGNNKYIRKRYDFLHRKYVIDDFDNFKSK